MITPRVDITLALSNREARPDWGDLLERARRRTQLADRLGFGGVWLGEHHFDHDGSDVSPNPIMLGADLAARTEQIRMCMGAVSLTLWHPVRVAEDLAMLDHFSNGRLDVAFARGILPYEIVNINPDANRKNPEKSKAIFRENLEIVRRAWGMDKFNWQGERYTLPQPGLKYGSAPGAPPRVGYTNAQGEMINISVVPRPRQKPMPRIWSTTENIEGFVEAASSSLGAITWYPTGRRLHEMFAAYQKARAEKTGTAPPLGDGLALLRYGLVARTDAEARALIEPALNDYYRFICSVRGRGVWLDSDDDPEDPRLAEMKPFDLMIARDHLMVGSPQSVAERMLRMMKSHGVAHWLINLAMPGLPSDVAERSIELFGREVLPALRGALA